MLTAALLSLGVFSPFMEVQSARPSAQGFVGSLAMDGLGLFVLLVAVVVSLMGLWGSLGRPGITSYVLQVFLFIGAVFLMVSSTNLLLFFVLWEIVVVISWSLSRRGGVHSYPALGPLPMQGIGGIATICMLGALMYIAVDGRTLSMAPIQGAGGSFIAILVLAAVFLKTYGLLTLMWLPSEPRVSGISNALLIGGSIVAVGVYPYVRVFWTILGGQEVWRGMALPVSLAVGAVAAVIALGEHDARRLISYGAFSQFAWFLAAFALYEPEQAGALFLSLATCLLAMSGLCILLGLAESMSGERDLRRLGGLIGAAPLVSVLFLLLVAAAAGLPPFAGFVGRLIVELPLLTQGNLATTLVLFGLTVTTFLYLLRLFGGMFLGELRRPTAEVRGTPEYLVVSTLLVALLAIGLTSPVFVEWVQVGLAMPFG